MASICTQCGYEGRAKKTLRGSRGMEIFIWTVLLFPGPLYSLWRRVGLRGRCPNCGKESMVRAGSVEGLLAQRQFDTEFGVIRERKAPVTPAATQKSTRIPMDDNPSPRYPHQPVDPDAW